MSLNGRLNRLRQIASAFNSEPEPRAIDLAKDPAVYLEAVREHAERQRGPG
jgi:hypothetical protein